MDLDEARAYVEELSREGYVRTDLPGDIELSDLIEFIGSKVNAGIKENLAEAMTTEEQLQQAIEQIAMQIALICIYAAANGPDDPAEADVELGISSETVTEVLKSLSGGNGVTIKLSVED